MQRSVLGSTREMRNWSTFSVWRGDGLAHAYPKHFGCGIGGRRLTEKRWRRRRGPIISIALQYGISHPQQGQARYVGAGCGIAVAQQQYLQSVLYRRHCSHDSNNSMEKNQHEP